MHVRQVPVTELEGHREHQRLSEGGAKADDDGGHVQEDRDVVEGDCCERQAVPTGLRVLTAGRRPPDYLEARWGTAWRPCVARTTKDLVLSGRRSWRPSCVGLENRYGPKRSIEGSNPSPSALLTETPAQRRVVLAVTTDPTGRRR